MPRSIEVLKNDRKFQRVFLFLHKEIDAFVFSGPEQFFNGAPMFSPLPFTMIFRREFDRFHCVDRSRCSKMLGIYYWIAICFPKEIDAFLFSGPEQFFNGAPMFSPLPFTMIFRREFDRFHRVDRSRCSKMLGIYYWTLVHTDSIYHPATTAAPLSILFGTHPPSRYILHLFFFPAILLLFLLVFFLSFFLFLSLPLSLPLPPFSSLINLRTSLKAR